MNDHLIRYKTASTDDWYYTPLITTKAEAITVAKTIGKAELGRPAYHAVEVVQIVNPPIVWSSNVATVPPTELEQPLSSDGG